MPRRAGERRWVTLNCGHAQSALVESIAKGRAWCSQCQATRFVGQQGPRFCADCGTRLNRYNQGAYCGAHERRTG